VPRTRGPLWPRSVTTRFPPRPAWSRPPRSLLRPTGRGPSSLTSDI
jgi:hypothetical protein